MSLHRTKTKIKSDKLPRLEKHIEAPILNYLRFFDNIFAWKNPTTGRYIVQTKSWIKTKGTITGVSDIIAIYKRKCDGICLTLFLEVKTEKGVQTDAQKEFQKNIEKLNGLYFIVRSIDDVKKVLEFVENKKIP